MGLFDEASTGQSSELSPQLAIMTIVVSAITSDGNLTDSELTRLRAMCSLSPVFHQSSPEEDVRLFKVALTSIRNHGPSALEKAAQALTPDLRETAFAYACDMVLADGTVSPAEEAFMEDLSGTLELEADVAKSIAMAALIRNRGR